MIIRPCKEDERQETIDLINQVFRTNANLDETMHLEFPLLLGADNVDQMMIAKVDHRVVAVVNYYIYDIIIQSTSLKAASIGAVCTHEEFRGQGIASKILDYIDKTLAKENVHLQIISGSRGLYTSRGATLAGESYGFLLNQGSSTPSPYKLEEYKEEDQKDLIRLYNNEPVRYYRTYDQFLALQKGATYNWGPHEYKIFSIKNQESMIGYIVVDLNKETNIARTKEVAGNRGALAQVLPELYDKLEVEKIYAECPWNDPLVPLLKHRGIEHAQINQYCTVKTLDYLGLMERLQPYFEQFISKEVLDALVFGQSGESYRISYQDETLKLQSIEQVNLLLLGGLDFNLQALCGEKKKLYQVLKQVFPLAFVWMSNMNFI